MLADLEGVRRVLEAHPKVVSAWHFGSTQKGTARADSDVDIAVFVSSELVLADYLQLQEGLQQALVTDSVDLAVLNGASAVLQFEAISGRNLVCKDADRQAAFISLACRRYEDSMAMLARGYAYWRAAR